MVDIALAQQLGLELHIVCHRHDLLQRIFAHLGVLHHGFQQVEVIVLLIFHTKNPPSAPSVCPKGEVMHRGLLSQQILLPPEIWMPRSRSSQIWYSVSQQPVPGSSSSSPATETLRVNGTRCIMPMLVMHSWGMAA